MPVRPATLNDQLEAMKAAIAEMVEHSIPYKQAVEAFGQAYFKAMLAKHARRNGRPNMSALARDAGMHRNTATRHVDPVRRQLEKRRVHGVGIVPAKGKPISA